MKGVFDKALLQKFQDISNTVAVSNFVKAFRTVLHLWLDKDDLTHIEEVIHEGRPVDASIIRRVLHYSETAAFIFAEFGMKLGFDDYLQLIQEKLKDLEFHDFEPAEMKNFRMVMYHEANRLTDSGHKSFDHKEALISFLAYDIRVLTATLNDDWQFRLAACLKTTALNAGTLKFLPWEALLFKAGEIPNARQTCVIGEGLILDMINVRDAVLKLVGQGPYSFSEMRRVVSMHLKSLLTLERTFLIEHKFLMEHAEGIATNTIHSRILDLLPSESNTRSFAEVHCGLKRNKLSTDIILSVA